MTIRVAIACTSGRNSIERLTALMLGGAMAIIFASGVANASPATPTSPPADDVVIQQDSPELAPPVSGQDAIDARAKAQLAAAVAARYGFASSSRVGAADVTASLPTSYRLGVVHEYQPLNGTDPAWCGPATIVMMTNYLGRPFSGTDGYNRQANAASYLDAGPAYGGKGTDWHGTSKVPAGPWRDSTTLHYVMKEALNWKTYSMNFNSLWYVVQGLPGTPSASDTTAYKNALVLDVYSAWYNGSSYYKWPLAVNEYKASGTTFPNQPTFSEIHHWFTSIGYYSSGSGSYYQDPGFGPNTYSSVGSSQVVLVAGGRGYVW